MSIVSTANSFEDLKLGFEEKHFLTKTCLQLRGGWGEDTVSELKLYKNELKKLSENLKIYQSDIEQGKRDIITVNKLINNMDNALAQLSDMKKNLPRLPYNPHGTAAQAQIEEQTLEIPSNNPEIQIASLAAVPPKLKPIPKFDFISIPDFEAVPKYIRGRLKYEQVNDAVEKLNQTLESKYNLCRKKRSQLTPIEMDMVATFKNQVNAECKGLHFVVDNDLKKFSNFKMDNAARSILTLLRTSKKIKEVRGPKQLVRYCIFR